jgi:hypothetical protein
MAIFDATGSLERTNMSKVYVRDVSSITRAGLLVLIAA